MGCRRRELAVDLLRVVSTDGHVGDDGQDPDVATVVVDVHRRLPGRGAWLHPHGRCYHLAVKRRAFARALRITGKPDTTGVFEYLAALEVPDLELGN